MPPKIKNGKPTYNANDIPALDCGGTTGGVPCGGVTCPDTYTLDFGSWTQGTLCDIDCTQIPTIVEVPFVGVFSGWCTWLIIFPETEGCFAAFRTSGFRLERRKLGLVWQTRLNSVNSAGVALVLGFDGFASWPNPAGQPTCTNDFTMSAFYGSGQLYCYGPGTVQVTAGTL